MPFLCQIEFATEISIPYNRTIIYYDGGFDKAFKKSLIAWLIIVLYKNLVTERTDHMLLFMKWSSTFSWCLSSMKTLNCTLCYIGADSWFLFCRVMQINFSNTLWIIFYWVLWCPFISSTSVKQTFHTSDVSIHF